MKILVIEDNESVCSMLEMFFLKEGYEGKFIHNGKEALEFFLENQNWDTIIIDWMLPGMEGVT
ncbi:response regulator, partial [Pseudomonas sp. SWRI111]